MKTGCRYLKRKVCSGKAADLLLQLGGDVVNYKNGPFADG